MGVGGEVKQFRSGRTRRVSGFILNIFRFGAPVLEYILYKPHYLIVSALLFCAAPVAADTETQVLFGDTHLHSAYSFDAFLNDNDSAFPDDAYRWARGLPVIHPTNRVRVQIDTPLDFLVVSDHAETLGVLTELHSDRSLLSDMGLWGNFKRWVTLEIADYLIDSGRAEMIFTYALPKPSIGA